MVARDLADSRADAALESASVSEPAAADAANGQPHQHSRVETRMALVPFPQKIAKRDDRSPTGTTPTSPL